MAKTSAGEAAGKMMIEPDAAQPSEPSAKTSAGEAAGKMIEPAAAETSKPAATTKTAPSERLVVGHH
jgi:hypothetical protein